MDFTLSEETEDIRQKISEFIETRVIPIEFDNEFLDEHEMISEPVLKPLRLQAKELGLWALQMPKELGGQGLSVVEMATCYEEMSRSPFGPVIFNCAAPDDGNMMILNKVLSESMKPVWLQPIVNGNARSAFAMTEPMPGSGSASS